MAKALPQSGNKSAPARAQYRYEYGKRWDARVPRADLHWLMGRVHVGTSDAEIEADIRKRCDGKAGYTASLINQSVAYALECHKRNRDLFNHYRF